MLGFAPARPNLHRLAIPVADTEAALRHPIGLFLLVSVAGLDVARGLRSLRSHHKHYLDWLNLTAKSTLVAPRRG